MRARYRFDEALADPVRACVPDLDLFEAASFGDVERLTELLAIDSASVDARSGDGFTALHLAAFVGQVDAVQLLVTVGAEVDARGTGWMTGTALHSAASARHSEVVQVLLEAGADPIARQSGGWTPLHAAARNGDLTSVTLLLVAGGDASAVNDDDASVLDIAQEGGDEGTIAAIADKFDR
ncbi:MAG: ankyrin repeat domain-containing protein [Actinomycetota bacterium]